MKRVFTFLLSMMLLTLLTQVRAEQTSALGVTYLNNTFTEASDTVGWSVSGDGLDATSNYNWKWYKYSTKYMKCGKTYAPNTTFTYTLTTPEMPLSSRGADLSFRYVKAATESSFMVYVLHHGVRQILLGNLLPTGNTTTWFDAEASLRAYAGDTIQLVFEHTNITSVVYLDDVKVEESPLCPEAKHVALTALHTTSATFSWDNSTSDTYIMLLSSVPQLDPSAAAPAEIVFQDTITATPNGSTGWTYSKDNLTEGTSYYVYLQSDCSTLMHGYGTWSTGFNFQTPCNGQPVPYTMDFDSLAKGEVPSCWISQSTYETQPGVINPRADDAINTTNVFSITNNMNSECMLVLPLFSADVKTLMLSFDAMSDEEDISFQIGLTNDLSDAQNIVTLSNQTLTSSWETYTFFLDNTFTDLSSNYYIVFYLSSGETASVNAFHVYLDNITVETTPSCIYPLNVEINTVLDHSCTLTWIDPNNTVTDYTVEYTAAGGTAQTVTTTTNPFTLTGLTQDTEYSIRVRSHCNATDYSAYSTPQTIHTIKSPIMVTTETAGTEDFEGTSSSFTSLYSESSNVWAVGSAQAHSPTHAMYISGDYGMTCGALEAAYNSYAYTYANISLPAAGNYTISFSWKGSSFSIFTSYMYAFFTTPEKEIELNSSWSTSESGTTLLGSKFSETEDGDWKNEHYIVNVSEAGTYRLVFYRYTYKSSSYAGDYSAIDDVQIRYIACDAPTALNQTSASTTSVGLSWTSAASNFTVKAFTTPIDVDSIEGGSVLPAATANSSTPSVVVTGLSSASLYYFYVQAQCDATHRSVWVGPLLAVTDCDPMDLPFSYDFNNDIDATIPLCWRGTPDKTMVETSPSSSYNIDNTPVLQFEGGSLDYAMLPQFNTPIAKSILEFDYNHYSSRYSGDIVVGYVTDASDMTTFVPIDTFACSHSVVHAMATFDSVDVAITGRIVIVQKAGSSSKTKYGGAIDNIMVYQTPSCWPIAALGTASNIQETSFTLQWTPNSLSTSRHFKVEYGTMGFTPGSTDGTILNVTDTFCTLTGLQSSTRYDVYVSTDCGTIDGTSIAVMGTYKTLVPPADGINYSCNFEDSTENRQWTLVNASGKNAWEIGTQSAYEGSYGLYVVDDEGTLGYSEPNDNCWAYRTLHCVTGIYTVTLDYKCKGQSTYDYMNCVVVPGDYSPETGSDGGITHSSIPETWFTGDPLKMNLQEHWTSYTFQFSVNVESDMTLALHWANNSSGYYDPASVDNITVRKLNCRPVYDLDLDSLSQTTAKIMWSSDNYDHFEVILDTTMHSPEDLDTLVSAAFIDRQVGTESVSVTGLKAAETYYAYVRNNCSDSTQAAWSEVYSFTTLCNIYSLPFTESFETNAVNGRPLCWSYFAGDEVKVSQTQAFDFQNSLYLRTADASSIRLALPMVHMPLSIEHYQLVLYAYRNITSNPKEIQIALNSAEDVSSIELNSLRLNPIIIPTSEEAMWKRIVVPFEHPTDIITGQPITMGEDQIIFITIPGPADLYLDAVRIEEIPACGEPYDVSIDSVLDRSIYYSWHGPATSYEIQCISADETDTITRTVTGDSAIFSGLSPHTAYRIHLRALCSTSETSIWSQFLSFATVCSIEQVPYLEDFSSLSTGDFPPCWGVDLESHYENWIAINNDKEAYMYLGVGYHYSSSKLTLSTPEIDLSTATQGTMFFDMKGTDYTATPTALFIIDETADQMDTLISSLLFTSDWTTFEVDIQAYIGHIVRFEFIVQTMGYSPGDIAIDHVGVEDRLYVSHPTGLRVSDPTTNSVVVHVNTDPSATSHNVSVVPENETFDPLTAPITPMTLPDSVLVTGLQPNTYYKAYAQAIHGIYESKWVGIARFNTSCAAQTLPLIENFETTVNGAVTLPLCWTTVGSVSASEAYPTSGQGSVKLASSAQIISPEITTDLNTAEVYFNGYATSGSPVIVSVCSDPLDMRTKLAVDTVTVLDDNSKTLNVDFTAVPSGYHYVVLENGGTGMIYLDNIVIRTYATCRFPESFTIGTIEKGKTNILITDSESATYDIYYNFTPEVDIHQLTATVSQVSDSSWITGLEGNKSYTVFVRKNCGTSQGQWIGPLNFTSACTAITLTDESPFIEDFSTLTKITYDLPACWLAIHNSKTSTPPYVKQYYSSSTYDPSRFHIESGLEDSVYLVLPEYANALNTLRWEFSIKPESGSSYTTTDRCLELGSMSDPSDESTFMAFDRVILSGVSTYSYTPFDIDLRYFDIPANHHYLAFRVSNSNHYFRINAIKVAINHDCAIPRLSVSNIQDTAVTVLLNPIAGTSSLDLVLRNDNGTYTDTVLNLDVTTASYTFTALTAGHMYYIQARSSCGEAMSDWSKPLVCITPYEAITSYPYSCNFEDATENGKWNHPNGGLTNQWIMGNDTNGFYEGHTGLYVSENNTTATYNITLSTFTWATRQLHMDPGSYKISFMAKVGGQSTYDVMRAFLVDNTTQLLPCDYESSTWDEFDYTSMIATSEHAGFIDLFREDHYVSASEWALHTFNIVITEPTDAQLAFLWRSDASNGSQPGACIDSITISLDDCPAPLQVDFVQTKSNRVTLSSRDVLEVDTVHLHYAIVWRDSTFNDLNTVVTASSLSGDTITLGGLMPSTRYDLYTARTCLDGSLGAWSAPMPFKTTAAPGAVPYFCGFEPSEAEATAWTFYNDYHNAWMVENMNPLTDDYSMFISNDQEHTTYNHDGTQYSYAVRSIHFEPGTYDFSFSWICAGESSYDYFMVALTPDDFTPKAGLGNINGTQISSSMPTPEGSKIWIKFNQESTLQTAAKTFSIPTTCDMNLTFVWTNDYSGGTDPGAIVDDITITKHACASPFDLHTEALTSTSATIAWTSSARSTHLTLRASGNVTPIADTTVTDTFFVLNGLRATSSYTCQAYSICTDVDTSSLSDLLSFTTPCATYALPFDEAFELNITYPDCWQEMKGIANLNGTTSSSTLSVMNSAWDHKPSEAGHSPHQKINIYGAYETEWLISPLITLDEAATLSFELALTDYSTWNAPEDEDGADDKFAVLISRDYGTTWQALASWTSTSETGHQFFDIPNSFEKQVISIPNSENHAPIQIAFYGESTVTNSDNDIHLDNIHMNCLSSDTMVIFDTICQGYAYGRNGFSIPADQVSTVTMTQLIPGDAYTCDQMKELHLFVQPRYDLIENATICQGQSYPFGTSNLTEGGEYLKTLSTVGGCDSVVHLNLTVTQLIVNIDTMICEGDYLDFEGERLTVSGHYSDTLRNAEGCDSVRNLHLNVLPATSRMDTTICEGDAVTMGSTVYTTQGLYIDTLKNVLDCDSTVTLNLTVIPSDSVYSDQFCSNSSYNFRGTILRTPGVYTDTIHDYLSSGCDYVYTLTLSETIPDTVEISDQFCEGMSSFYQHGFNIDDPEEKDYIVTKTSGVTGCDSVTILHLSKINTVYGSIAQTICDNESYTFGGKEYYATGTYEHTFASTVTGCDSIVTLTLTVNPTYTVDVNDSIEVKQLPYTNLTLVVPVGTEVGTYDYTIESATEAGCDSTIYLTLTITQNIGLNNVNVATLDFYPNVVKGGDNVTITTDFSESERQGMSIRLYDATGKLIATYQPQSAGTMSYTMPSVSGMYYLRLETKSGKAFSGKLIIL